MHELRRGERLLLESHGDSGVMEWRSTAFQHSITPLQPSDLFLFEMQKPLLGVDVHLEVAEEVQP